MPHIYLAPWEWNTTEQPGSPFWDAPFAQSCLQRIDLRPLPAQAEMGGVPQGFGLFVYDRQIALPGAVYLGNDVKRALTQPERDSWKGSLNISEPLEGVTLDDVLWNSLTIHADASGLRRVRPLMPQANGELSLHSPSLNLVRRKRVGLGDLEWNAIVGVLHADYRRLRQEFLDAYPVGDPRRVHYKKLLGYWMQKYRVLDHLVFVPADLPDEGWLSPSTTITESWDCTDATDNIDCDQTWAEDAGFNIASNQVEVLTTHYNIEARLEADLSGDDHYAQVEVATTADSANAWGGPGARFSANAKTCYVAIMFFPENSTRIYKIVSDSYSALSPGVSHSLVASTFYPGKIECSGSTIKSFIGGTEKESITDTAITGNVRTGIAATKDSGGAIQFNNFEAADLAIGGGFSHSRVVIVG